MSQVRQADSFLGHAITGQEQPLGSRTVYRRQPAGEVENKVLLGQNAALRQSLAEVQAELRVIRLDQLGARARDGLHSSPARDAELDDLRNQRDTALASSQLAEADLAALRNLDQRLMVEIAACCSS